MPTGEAMTSIYGATVEATVGDIFRAQVQENYHRIASDFGEPGRWR